MLVLASSVTAVGSSAAARKCLPARFREFRARITTPEQTLKQIVREDGSMSGVRITDRPRFAYRGFLLDSARR